MYLLHTTNLTLQEFFADVPEYAILSHTWTGEEVTFQDIQNDRRKSDWKKTGWQKVKGACAEARKYRWEWIWIDSCCIDKSSSAELSENINSMYRLYENAAVCYVYLCDASSEEDPRDSGSRFWESRWFTRGWTLQELIAPSASVIFLDHSWKKIGTRYSLRDVISTITSIPVGLLKDGDLTKYSIAQKMSWAAFRKTTRPEDRAYSLMGLFDICMPPIYGEGEAKAFMRLQQEIIKTSDDRSVFAWVADCGRHEKWKAIEHDPRGLFARSPDEFKGSGRVGISRANFAEDTSFSFNNNGLRIHFPIVPINDVDTARASLNCKGDTLRFFPDVRCHPDTLVLCPSFETPKNVQGVIVKEIPPSRKTRGIYTGTVFINRVRLLPTAEERFRNLTCIGSVSNPFGFLSSRSFTVKFSCRRSDETVGISFATPEEGGGMLKMASFLKAVGGARYADLLTVELGSGGFVSAAVHITGRKEDGWTGWTEREIDIDYTSSSLIPTLRYPQSQFIEIPSVLRHSLRNVFPSNHSDHISSDDWPSCRYLSLSKEVSGVCRILDYGGDIIAIGINEGGGVWVHAPQRIGEESTKEIWDSYQENGSRAQFRGNSSSMFRRYAKATVYKNDGLQFASHSLVFIRAHRNAPS
ncbi:HET-domain-containing protein [Dendrothele bispora CBS 962.96]|uniref:HET-domain-containing protein n=1 Tax=Dendrothele bispora (strain CBS 962.96) TaxID=1314807 RepID=A0A4S8L7U3_DENBC|nr:HET-domain-containing protein [Dendrothele bispora CBS 962.96]